MVRLCRSALGKRVRVTPGAILHVQLRHPEVRGLKVLEDLIAEVIEDPDIVVKGKHGESIALRSLERLSGSAKYLVVPYDEGGEVKTAFITSQAERIMRREVLWRRS